MTILVYADDIILLNNTQLEVIQIMEKLIQVRKINGLFVNEAEKMGSKLTRLTICMVDHAHIFQ